VTNRLWNGTRFMSPTDEVPDEDVGTAVMTGVMALATFPEFGGTASSSGAPEGTPHGAVHVDVGGDKGSFNTAGNDPVFYATPGCCTSTRRDQVCVDARGAVQPGACERCC